MAKLDDLIEQVTDPALRAELGQAVQNLRRRKTFGLVFEEHIPEITLLGDVPVKVGATVYRRDDTNAKTPLTVTRADGSTATVITAAGEEMAEPVEQLLVLRRFGDPIYPTLVSIDKVARGGERPYHAVIDGENYHALQLLRFMYEGAVDCIYADPPYNTGARDWKYNNDFVDKNDRWRHSKWLSMMEKRLRLAKLLLKPNGVLIVTIDENELHHLGMLLEQIFPRARRQMVSICIQPSGASGEGLSRVEEYAIFCFLGDAEPVATVDDMLTESTQARSKVRWESLMRGGSDWYRAIRRNLCYPILLDDHGERIVGVGAPLPDEVADKDRPTIVDSHRAAWPVRDDRRLGIWRVDRHRLMTLAAKGYAYVSSQDKDRGTWTIRYLLQGTVTAIERGEIPVNGTGPRGQALVELAEPKRVLAKTIWHRGRHTAGGAGGSHMLVNLLGERGTFPFPKSVYAVQDCLEVAIGDRPNALILDFFAGSGTTLHAACLLNRADGGQRQCVLVTNNEVEDQLARRMNKSGLFAGDAEHDRHGVFEAVCKPRCMAAITGRRANDEPVPGHYLDDRAYADGFEENCAFLRLEYLEPDEVELGRQFAAIVPILWLASGGLGPLPDPTPTNGYLLPPTSPFAVLLRESALRRFMAALEKRADVTHVWLVTDSERAFADMRAVLPGDYSVAMLYRDYLRNFAIKTVRSA